MEKQYNHFFVFACPQFKHGRKSAVSLLILFDLGGGGRRSRKCRYPCNNAMIKICFCILISCIYSTTQFCFPSFSHEQYFWQYQTCLFFVKKQYVSIIKTCFCISISCIHFRTQFCFPFFSRESLFWHYQTCLFC